MNSTSKTHHSPRQPGKRSCQATLLRENSAHHKGAPVLRPPPRLAFKNPRWLIGTCGLVRMAGDSRVSDHTDSSVQQDSAHLPMGQTDKCKESSLGAFL